MSAVRIARRDRRALQAGALVLALALLLALVVRPAVRWYRGTRDAVAAERALLARERGLLAAAPRLPAVLARAIAAASAADSLIYTERDATSATALLVADVRAFAEEHTVRVRQTEMREPGPDAGGLAELSVRLEAEGDLEGILGFLQALEHGAPLLRVSRLAIVRVPAPGAEARTLTLSAVVHGVGRVGAAPGDDGEEADSSRAAVADPTLRADDGR